MARTGVGTDVPRVLIVEDDAALRDIYAGALSGFGHDVRAAAEGGEALSLLENGWKPCLIFLDLRMPGIDGWELTRRVRADDRWRDIPIVVVAAHFRIDHEARELGAAGWLQKPFDLTQLDDYVQTLCNRKAS
ncbi:MAG TPA: response regulator [Candidatus Limnocylindria bacterium]|nr:response regulator [Candidatus Limnocylindria bacterium]